MNAEQNPARVFQPQRWVGAIVFLALFFLPLHFHSSVAAQVTKECSCVHGTRTQLALNADVPLVAPAPRIEVLVVAPVTTWDFHQTHSQHVRGPPATRST